MCHDTMENPWDEFAQIIQIHPYVSSGVLVSHEVGAWVQILCKVRVATARIAGSAYQLFHQKMKKTHRIWQLQKSWKLNSQVFIAPLPRYWPCENPGFDLRSVSQSV